MSLNMVRVLEHWERAVLVAESPLASTSASPELTPPSGLSLAAQQGPWFYVSVILPIFPLYPTMRLFSPIQFNSIKPALI